MHICIISSYFPQPCGIASYTHYLTRALKALDDSLKLTLITEKSNQEMYLAPFDIFPVFNREEDYSSQLTLLIKKLNPDVVHIQHEYGIFGYDNRFLKLLEQLRSLGIASIVTFHTVHTKLSFFTGCSHPQTRNLLKKIDIEKYQRRVGELANMIFVHQEKSIRQILLRQGIPTKKIITIPHGTLIAKTADKYSAKSALGVKTDDPLILAFGYLEPSKNLLLLIKAFRRVKMRLPDAKLFLCGYIRFSTSKSVSYKARCLKLIDDYKLNNDVIFTDDAIPEDKVSEVLGAADIITFAYNEDTRSSSGALHVALGLGKPVVASRIPKFEELSGVSDELLVNPQSVRELSALLIRLIRDQDFNKYVCNRVKLYAKQTAWPSVAKKHNLIYYKLAPVQAPQKLYLKIVNQ
jgi:glycosyltransferase involved in cell wall biosynthesis